MLELVIVSGKGGTGKTSLVGSLAVLAKDNIMVDCDVDAADLHLILNNNVEKVYDFIASSKASIDQEKCNDCGLCMDYCRFEAIKHDGFEYRIDQLACEGCGVCRYFCPVEAIDFRKVKSGEWYLSSTSYGPLIHARLGIAQSNSGRLVSLLRKEALQLAEENNKNLIIIDGPPGIGCPVIASITGAGFVLIVTEPSLSAFHDMKRLLTLVNHFKIPVGLCINKFDINNEITKQIENFARENSVIVCGKIPFDPMITKAQVAGTTLVEYTDSIANKQIKLLWENIKKETTHLNNQKDKYDFIQKQKSKL